MLQTLSAALPPSHCNKAIVKSCIDIPGSPFHQQVMEKTASEHEYTVTVQLADHVCCLLATPHAEAASAQQLGSSTSSMCNHSRPKHLTVACRLFLLWCLIHSVFMLLLPKLLHNQIVLVRGKTSPSATAIQPAKQSSAPSAMGHAHKQQAPGKDMGVLALFSALAIPGLGWFRSVAKPLMAVLNKVEVIPYRHAQQQVNVGFSDVQSQLALTFCCCRRH